MSARDELERIVRHMNKTFKDCFRPGKSTADTVIKMIEDFKHYKLFEIHYEAGLQDTKKLDKLNALFKKGVRVKKTIFGNIKIVDSKKGSKDIRTEIK